MVLEFTLNKVYVAQVCLFRVQIASSTCFSGGNRNPNIIANNADAYALAPMSKDLIDLSYTKNDIRSVDAPPLSDRISSQFTQNSMLELLLEKPFALIPGNSLGHGGAYGHLLLGK